MNTVDKIILEASSLPPKTKGEKGFRQVWFTRPEMKAAILATVNKLLEQKGSEQFTVEDQRKLFFKEN